VWRRRGKKQNSNDVSASRRTKGFFSTAAAFSFNPLLNFTHTTNNPNTQTRQLSINSVHHV
jgi:hypothetical protein